MNQFIVQLPIEIQYEIFEYLTHEDLQKLSDTCFFYHHLCNFFISFQNEITLNKDPFLNQFNQFLQNKNITFEIHELLNSPWKIIFECCIHFLRYKGNDEWENLKSLFRMSNTIYVSNNLFDDISNNLSSEPLHIQYSIYKYSIDFENEVRDQENDILKDSTTNIYNFNSNTLIEIFHDYKDFSYESFFIRIKYDHLNSNVLHSLIEMCQEFIKTYEPFSKIMHNPELSDNSYALYKFYQKYRSNRQFQLRPRYRIHHNDNPNALYCMEIPIDDLDHRFDSIDHLISLICSQYSHLKITVHKKFISFLNTLYN